MQENQTRVLVVTSLGTALVVLAIAGMIVEEAGAWAKWATFLVLGLWVLLPNLLRKATV